MIYVTEIMVSRPNKKWLHSESAYVVCDTLERLHQLALKHKFPERWFRGNSYQITRTKQGILIRCGAKVVKDPGEFSQLAQQMVEAGS